MKVRYVLKFEVDVKTSLDPDKDHDTIEAMVSEAVLEHCTSFSGQPKHSFLFQDCAYANADRVADIPMERETMVTTLAFGHDMDIFLSRTSDPNDE